MGRSLKKGPFCDDHLMKKVVAAGLCVPFLRPCGELLNDKIADLQE